MIFLSKEVSVKRIFKLFGIAAGVVILFISFFFIYVVFIGDRMPGRTTAHKELGGGYSIGEGGVFSSEWGENCTSFFSECWGDVKITDADPETFVYAGGAYAKDKNYAYFNPARTRTQRTEDVDLTTFQGLSGEYAKDKNSIYYGIEKVADVDLATFEVFFPNQSSTIVNVEQLYKDKNSVYYGRLKIKDADPKTFVILRRGESGAYYARDKNSLFYGIHKITEADPATFQFINANYSKDKNRVYFLGTYASHPCLEKPCSVQGADVQSFVAFDSAQECGQGCVYDAQDKNYKYRDGQEVR